MKDKLQASKKSVSSKQVANDVISSNSPLVLYTGNYTFKFDLFVKGASTSHSCDLIATAYKIVYGDKIQLPLVCNWKKEKEKILQPLEQHKSNTYQLSPDDIGYNILLEAKLADEDAEYHGIAHAKFGPVTFDSKQRKEIDQIIANGGISFPVKQVKEVPNEEYFLEFTNNEITIKVTINDQIKRQKFPYGWDSPRIMLNSFDNKLFDFITTNYDTGKDKSTESFIKFNAMNRNKRDLITLLLRFYCSRKMLQREKIMDVIGNDINKLGITELIDYQQTKRELSLLMNQSHALYQENTKLRDHVQNLEKEFDTTISQYNTLIKNSGIEQSNKMEEDLDKQKKKVTILEKENKTLIETHEALKKDELNLNQKISVVTQMYDSKNQECNEIKNKMSQLKLQNEQLTHNHEQIKSQLDKLSKESNIKNEEQFTKLINDQNQKITKLTEENETLALQRNLITKKKDDLVKEVERLRKEIENEIKNKTQDGKLLTDQNEQLRGDTKKLKEDLEETKRALKAFDEQCTIEKEKRIKLEKEIEKLNKNDKLEEMNKVSHELQLKNDELTEKLENLRVELDEKDELIAKLENDNKILKLSSNNS